MCRPRRCLQRDVIRIMRRHAKWVTIKRQNKGVALITALLMTSMAAILAVSLVSDQQLNLRRTSNVLDSDRAHVFAVGVESWVMHILARDDKARDSLDEDWAVILPPIVVEDGSVAGRIEDMQGRFNINNLVDDEGKRSPADVERFMNLLRSVGLDEALVPAVVDWLDKDSEPTFEGGWGAEDDEYSTLDVPYRTANQKMKSSSELLLVKGMTTKSYQLLAPFVAALPSRTKINVNTAPLEVIMSLSADITRADAEAVLAAREEGPFDSVQAFKDLDVIPGNSVAEDAIGVTSNYFLVDATARYGRRGKVQMYSLLVRNGEKVSVVSRSQGVF